MSSMETLPLSSDEIAIVKTKGKQKGIHTFEEDGRSPLHEKKQLQQQLHDGGMSSSDDDSHHHHQSTTPCPRSSSLKISGDDANSLKRKLSFAAPEEDNMEKSMRKHVTSSGRKRAKKSISAVANATSTAAVVSSVTLNNISSSVATPPTRTGVHLTERQQLALLLKMGQPKETCESGRNTTVSEVPAVSKCTRTTSQRLSNDKSNAKNNRKKEKRLFSRNERGETLLQRACIKGDYEAVKDLLGRGAPVNVFDYAGWAPIHEASNHGFVDVVKLLLDNGADVNCFGADNDTPLHDAAVNGHLEVIQVLLEHGANRLNINRSGNTPLDVARTDNVRDLLLPVIVSSKISSPSEDNNNDISEASSDYIENDYKELACVMRKEEILAEKVLKDINVTSLNENDTGAAEGESDMLSIACTNTSSNIVMVTDGIGTNEVTACESPDNRDIPISCVNTRIPVTSANVSLTICDVLSSNKKTSSNTETLKTEVCAVEPTTESSQSNDTDLHALVIANDNSDTPDAIDFIESIETVVATSSSDISATSSSDIPVNNVIANIAAVESPLPECERSSTCSINNDIVTADTKVAISSSKFCESRSNVSAFSQVENRQEQRAQKRREKHRLLRISERKVATERARHEETLRQQALQQEALKMPMVQLAPLPISMPTPKSSIASPRTVNVSATKMKSASASMPRVTRPARDSTICVRRVIEIDSSDDDPANVVVDIGSSSTTSYRTEGIYDHMEHDHLKKKKKLLNTAIMREIKLLPPKRAWLPSSMRLDCESTPLPETLQTLSHWKKYDSQRSSQVAESLPADMPSALKAVYLRQLGERAITIETHVTEKNRLLLALEGRIANLYESNGSTIADIPTKLLLLFIEFDKIKESMYCRHQHEASSLFQGQQIELQTYGHLGEAGSKLLSELPQINVTPANLATKGTQIHS